MLHCGMGLRPELFDKIVRHKPKVSFFEAHSENYFGESLTRKKLLEFRRDYPISLHGVGLSLGRADQLDLSHLELLKELVDDVEPMLVSEHLAWSAYAHIHIPDLLPLPLIEESLDSMCQHIDQMQNALGRQVLIENPSNYLVFDLLQVPEPEFLNLLAQRTGCGILLDINNVYVSAQNIGRDARQYIEELDTHAIGEFHLAGHTAAARDTYHGSEQILIDTHNQRVCDEVWDLFDYTLAKHGGRPALVEWDSDFPDFSILMDQTELVSTKISNASTEIVAPHYSINQIARTTEESLSGKGNNQQLGALQSDFLTDLLKRVPANKRVIESQNHRISVYQNNYFAAVQDYLCEVFAAAVGVLGSDFFRQTVRTFIEDFPPSQGNLNQYGYQLIEFVEQVDGLDGIPYLTDLLRYEWAIHKTYYVGVEHDLDLTAMSQDELLSASVSLQQCVTVVSSEFPIYEIHRQSLPTFDGDVSISLDQSKDQLLVFKLGDGVQTVVMKDALALMIVEIEKNGNLMKAITALSGSVAPSDLSAVLTFILENKLLTKN